MREASKSRSSVDEVPESSLMSKSRTEETPASEDRPWVVYHYARKHLCEQECIPGGCVPPARYRSGGVCPVGGLPDRDPPGQSPPSRQRPPGQRPHSGHVTCGAWWDRDTPCEQNDWQTGVKTSPCRNFVAGGNKAQKLFLITTPSGTNSQPFSRPLDGVFTLAEAEKNGHSA